MINEILKTSKSVTPYYDHQHSVAKSLINFSSFFFDMGMKLRGKATESQIMRFKQLSTDYDNIRQTVAQNFIHEVKISEYEQVIAKQQKHIKELKKQVEVLEQTLKFN
jgi:hypothetical protein